MYVCINKYIYIIKTAKQQERCAEAMCPEFSQELMAYKRHRQKITEGTPDVNYHLSEFIAEIIQKKKYVSVSVSATKSKLCPKSFLSAMRPPQNCEEQLCLQLLRKINSKRIFVCICICNEMHTCFENNFSVCNAIWTTGNFIRPIQGLPMPSFSPHIAHCPAPFLGFRFCFRCGFRFCFQCSHFFRSRAGRDSHFSCFLWKRQIRLTGTHAFPHVLDMVCFVPFPFCHSLCVCSASFYRPSFSFGGFGGAPFLVQIFCFLFSGAVLRLLVDDLRLMCLAFWLSRRSVFLLNPVFAVSHV